MLQIGVNRSNEASATKIYLLLSQSRRVESGNQLAMKLTRKRSNDCVNRLSMLSVSPCRIQNPSKSGSGLKCKFLLNKRLRDTWHLLLLAYLIFGLLLESLFWLFLGEHDKRVDQLYDAIKSRVKLSMSERQDKKVKQIATKIEKALRQEYGLDQKQYMQQYRFINSFCTPYNT